MSPPPFAELRNRNGERLDFTFHPGATARGPVVVIAHGLTSYKDRPWLIALSEALAVEGIASLRFSFAGNGASEGRFEDATLTKEVDDLGSVLDALERAGFKQIALAGHSMGGAVSLLRTAVDPRVRALASLAGMFHVQSFMQRHFGMLVPGRDSMFDKPDCIWSKALAEDAVRIGSLFDSAARVRIPWLLVHGDADELVPFSDSLDAKAAADGRPELVTLPGVDHRFTGAVPEFTAAVAPWLRRVLL